MKILVTGAAGFIGTNLIKKLVDEGHEVHGLDNFSTGYRKNIVKNVPYIEQDVSYLKYWTADKDYKQYLKRSKKQRYHAIKNYSWEKMKELVDIKLDTNLPQFAKQVELKIPTLNIPKLNKVK